MYGIALEYSNFTLVYNNSFSGNAINAIDNGFYNDWNNSAIGNYWDDYDGIDIDGDGIGEIPYAIGGSAGAFDYLPIASLDDVKPIITINWPSSGDFYGILAPSFNINVEEYHLDTTWYTIDGGLTNFTFSGNDTINQILWDNLAGETIVTIRFYANDTTGNIGFADVTVVKDIMSPQIDITSPTPSDVFGVTAPSFNVRITDDYLDTMWYTLDGGLTNYTFTQNGTIEQTAWDAMPDGVIALQFYGNDTVGNIGSMEVVIEKDVEAPIIDITSPTPSDVFGVTAPSFNVRITDDNLDTMWYTLDGGLHNYTFTVNGSIDQSAWNAISDGAVILKFYANDTLGHIGSAEVSIIKDATAPTIVINSPTEGEEFGVQAPLFNITITDEHLDSIWYSFDGGVTTHAITNNAILNQTAWAALPEGDVTITFYASDTLGNEASESVTVIKNIPAGGPDTGVIITIIVVSVVVGVAIAAVAYFFIKKRAAPA